MFTDSVGQNVETLRTIISNLPPERKRAAKAAFAHIEKCFAEMQAAYPKDPGVALGCAFALFTIGERMVDNSKEKDSDTLIQLIN